MTRSCVFDGFLIHYDTLTDCDAHREWLVVLLETSIFSRIEDFFVSGSLLGEQALENMVCSFCIDELTAYGLYSRRVRARTWIETHKSLSSRLVWKSECASVEGWFLQLGLVNY